MTRGLVYTIGIVFLFTCLWRVGPRVSGRVNALEVTVTVYHAVAGQTDSSPFITASGFRIDPSAPGRHRIVAVSRDLRKRFGFGSRVLILGVGPFSGVWRVEDAMARRWKRRVDLLVDGKVRGGRFSGARIIALD